MAEKTGIMKNYFWIALLLLFLAGSTDSANAQKYRCYRAWKKDWKSDKKDSKIHKKMFHDHWRKAERKRYKSKKKAYKSERKEYEHTHDRVHDSYW